MKIEYLDDISDSGLYKQVSSENLIRLFDFDRNESLQLSGLIYQTLIVNKQQLDLSNQSFLDLVNCNLVFRLSTIDRGILKMNLPAIFSCELTIHSYYNMIEIIETTNEGYSWLSDTSTDNIDFLYSADGTW